MKGNSPIKRTPQDKKALSYAKDRRNAYGKNDKAARKAIPARKAGESRKSRRKAVQDLGVIDRVGEAAADRIDSSLAHDVERVGGWRKVADIPLGEKIARQDGRAKWREGRKVRVRAEVARQKAAPDFDGCISIGSWLHDRELD